MRKSIFFFFVMCLIGISVKAQDKIYRKNGQILKVKIIEIGTDEVKYKLLDKPDGPLYAIEKDKIRKLEYADGSIEKIAVDLKDPEQYADQRNKAIKIDFLGPLMGYTQFTFEKNTGVGKSYELSLGIIGAGKNQILDYYNSTIYNARKNQFGVTVAAGYKFGKLPDFLFGRTRFTHLMQGAYARPIVYLGDYSENRVVYKGNNQYVLEKQNVSFGALQVELGKQWVFGDRFLLDVYWGFGYGFDNKKGDGSFYDDGTVAYNYINARVGRSPGFSSTFALKVGFLLK